MKIKGEFIVFDGYAVRIDKIVYVERRESYNDTKIHYEIGNDSDSFAVPDTVDKIMSCIKRNIKRKE